MLLFGKGDTGVTGGCSFRECKVDGCSGCCIRFWNAFGKKGSGNAFRAPALSERDVPSIFIMSLPSRFTVDSRRIGSIMSFQFHSMKNCRHDGVTYHDRVATAVFNLVLVGNQCLAQFISLVSRRSLLTFTSPYTTASTLLASYASICPVQPTLFLSHCPIAAALLPFSPLSSEFVASIKSISKHRPRPKYPVQDSAHNRQALLSALAATARKFQETSRRRELAEAFGIPKPAQFRYVHFSSLCPSSSSQSLAPLLCFTQGSIWDTALASQRLNIITIALTDACVPVVPKTKTIRMPANLSILTNLLFVQSVTCMVLMLMFLSSHYVCTRQSHRPHLLGIKYNAMHCTS